VDPDFSAGFAEAEVAQAGAIGRAMLC
jgi:hypothetical protein